MRIIRHKPLSEAKNEVTKQALEQELSDVEIELIEQDRALTDHDIAILECRKKLEYKGGLLWQRKRLLIPLDSTSGTKDIREAAAQRRSCVASLN